MPKVTAAVLAALVALTLTGCASATESAADEHPAPAVSESATPLAAEPDEAEPVDDIEADFIERFHAFRAQNTLPSQIPDASDDDLVAAGHEACDRLAAGETSDNISVIDGETRSEGGYFVDSGAILSAANVTLCAS